MPVSEAKWGAILSSHTLQKFSAVSVPLNRREIALELQEKLFSFTAPSDNPTFACSEDTKRY